MKQLSCWINKLVLFSKEFKDLSYLILVRVNLIFMTIVLKSNILSTRTIFNCLALNLNRCFFFILVIICLTPSLQVLAKDDLNKVNIAIEKKVDGKKIYNTGNYFWVIYDNVCPYCRSATKHIKDLDLEGKFKFLSYRDPLTYKMFPNLSREECEKDVHMVTPKGELLSGYKVFRAIIDNLTATKLLNPLLKNDYAEAKLNEIYEKMVKERTCYYNKSGTCSLKAHNQKEGESNNEE